MLNLARFFIDQKIHSDMQKKMFKQKRYFDSLIIQLHHDNRLNLRF